MRFSHRNREDEWHRVPLTHSRGAPLALVRLQCSAGWGWGVSSSLGQGHPGELQQPRAEWRGGSGMCCSPAVSQPGPEDVEDITIPTYTAGSSFPQSPWAASTSPSPRPLPQGSSCLRTRLSVPCLLAARHLSRDSCVTHPMVTWYGHYITGVGAQRQYLIPYLYFDVIAESSKSLQLYDRGQECVMVQSSLSQPSPLEDKEGAATTCCIRW